MEVLFSFGGLKQKNDQRVDLRFAQESTHRRHHILIAFDDKRAGLNDRLTKVIGVAFGIGELMKTRANPFGSVEAVTGGAVVLIENLTGVLSGELEERLGRGHGSRWRGADFAGPILRNAVDGVPEFACPKRLAPVGLERILWQADAEDFVFDEVGQLEKNVTPGFSIGS